MPNPDYMFVEGFDKYGPKNYLNPAINGGSTNSNLTAALAAGEWTGTLFNFGTISLGSALAGTGYSIRQTAGTAQDNQLWKTFPLAYPRIIGGICYQCDAAGTSLGTGISLMNSSSAQISFAFNSSGQLVVRRGSSGGTILGTSSQVFSLGSPVFIEWDIGFDSGTSGYMKFYFNGGLDSGLNLSGITTGLSCNRIQFQGANNGIHKMDHLYIWGYNATGGSDTPALTNPIIVTSWADADDTVEFNRIADTVGEPLATVNTTTSASPGANQLVLRKYKTESTGDLNSVSMRPATTSSGALFKAVIYTDNGSETAPGTLIAAGTETTGSVSGTPLTMPFSSAVSLSDNTTYWIGYITNTSITVYATDDNLLGYRAGNTYTSGAPSTAPTLTGSQTSWSIWGNLTNTNKNYSAINNGVYGGTQSMLQSAVVGAGDLYNFTDITGSPSTVYSVAVKAYVAKTDTGVRSMNIRAKYGDTEGTGDNPGFYLSTTDLFYSSYFKTNPKTGLPWTPAEVNAAKFGYNINS